MATVWIPPLMRSLTQGQEKVEVPGETVLALIQAIDGRYPGFAARVLQDGELKPGLSVAVDGVVSPKGVRERVRADSEVHIVPAMSGGETVPG